MTMRDSTEVLKIISSLLKLVKSIISQVLPCNDDSSSIPTLTFNFVTIADLAKMQKDEKVDLIGEEEFCSVSMLRF